MLNAEATKDKVDAELADLQKTLKNIEEARPFEDLTVVCIILRMGEDGGVCVDGVMKDLWIREEEDVLRSSIFDTTRYGDPVLSSTAPFRMHICLHHATMQPYTPPFLHPPAMFWNGS